MTDNSLGVMVTNGFPTDVLILMSVHSDHLNVSDTETKNIMLNYLDDHIHELISADVVDRGTKVDVHLLSPASAKGMRAESVYVLLHRRP